MAKFPNIKAETVEIELFHVFVLPTLWLCTMLGIWIAFWNIGDDRILFLFTSGWVGWWLGCIGMALNSVFLFILLNSIGGVLAMTLVGFIQDLLHVRKWVAIVYPGSMVLFMIYARISGIDFPESRGDFIRSLLATHCLSIYVVSFFSCLLALGWCGTQKWRRS